MMKKDSFDEILMSKFLLVTFQTLFTENCQFFFEDFGQNLILPK